MRKAAIPSNKPTANPTQKPRPSYGQVKKPKKEKDEVAVLKDRLAKGARLSDQELATLELAAVARWTQLEREDNEHAERKRQQESERRRQEEAEKESKLQSDLEKARQAAAADRANLAMASSQVADELRELRELRDAALRDREILEEKMGDELRELRALKQKAVATTAPPPPQSVLATDYDFSLAPPPADVDDDDEEEVEAAAPVPPLFVNDDDEKENHEEAESSPPEEPVPEAVPQPQPPVPPVAAAEAASKAQKQPPSAPTTATTSTTSGSGARARGGSSGYGQKPKPKTPAATKTAAPPPAAKRPTDPEALLRETSFEEFVKERRELAIKSGEVPSAIPILEEMWEALPWQVRGRYEKVAAARLKAQSNYSSSFQPPAPAAVSEPPATTAAPSPANAPFASSFGSFLPSAGGRPGEGYACLGRTLNGSSGYGPPKPQQKPKRAEPLPPPPPPPEGSGFADGISLTSILVLVILFTVRNLICLRPTFDEYAEHGGVLSGVAAKLGSDHHHRRLGLFDAAEDTNDEPAEKVAAFARAAADAVVTTSSDYSQKVSKWSVSATHAADNYRIAIVNDLEESCDAPGTIFGLQPGSGLLHLTALLIGTLLLCQLLSQSAQRLRRCCCAPRSIKPEDAGLPLLAPSAAPATFPPLHLAPWSTLAISELLIASYSVTRTPHTTNQLHSYAGHTKAELLFLGPPTTSPMRIAVLCCSGLLLLSACRRALQYLCHRRAIAAYHRNHPNASASSSAQQHRPRAPASSDAPLKPPTTTKPPGAHISKVAPPPVAAPDARKPRPPPAKPAMTKPPASKPEQQPPGGWLAWLHGGDAPKKALTPSTSANRNKPGTPLPVAKGPRGAATLL